MTITDDDINQRFNTNITLLDGSSLKLPVSKDAPLYIVGPNGAGKSGLIHHLFRSNFNDAIRISAHRQTWMESNFVPFSPQDKATTEETVRGQDSQPKARTSEWNPSRRSGLVIADLIEADNTLSRKVRAAVVADKLKDAQKAAAELPPLDTISELFAASGIPIQLSITKDAAVEARKNQGEPYSIASLSDGERAALLIAGSILTAKQHSLILVDEPERHLHSSIVTPLLNQLFAKRADCTFVISTHELSLPVSSQQARTVLIRDSEVVNENITKWDVDILEPGTELDDLTKEAIIGSRRKLLFIEGTRASLDQPLYEILFPGITIFPRASCRDVEHAVISIRDTSSVAWVSAFGIVDQDQLTIEKKAKLESQNVFALSVYSVEGLYYHPDIVAAAAERQAAVIGVDAQLMVRKAWEDALTAVSSEKDRLAARMTEQAVKDQISIQMPDWKRIQGGGNVTISVDAPAMYEDEKAQLEEWLRANDVAKIMARYPIRETQALSAVVNALQFKSKSQYESAVRKLLIDEEAFREKLLDYFGKLPKAISSNQSSAAE